MLHQSFVDLLKRYTRDQTKIVDCWAEIVDSYLGSKRFYHTLDHLEHILLELIEQKDQISGWDTLLFTLYYHDIIYKSTRSDNELKSAEFAKAKMEFLNVPQDIIDTCFEQIVATKEHLFSNSRDINYFLDADLSILGSDWETYQAYFHNVRKEYKVYPDLIYNNGRKKVLKHFLNMDKIFKTDYFYEKYEVTARENLIKELHI